MTLHTSLQPVVPFPSAIGKAQSKFAKKAIEYLETLINTEVWDVLKIVALSIGFRWSLELLAFMGGFPPEQPVYFHAYMRDVFANRCQTRGLLDLILSLDEPLAEDYINYKKKTFIVSGFPDFVTGVYHSQRLAKSMPHAKHTMFRMGSHFLLLEWPDLLAEEILEFMDLTSSG